MTLHPQARAVLDMLAATGGVTASDEHLAEIRTGWAMLVALGCGEPEPVAEVTDLDVPGPAGPVAIRTYLPAAVEDDTADGLPVVVFFHGGGWTIGSVADYDPIARRVANATGALVVSVDYRLAPEAPHPAAVDDCWAATTWVAAHAAELGGDGTRLALMGDSAGGNLAAVVAQRAGERRRPGHRTPGARLSGGRLRPRHGVVPRERRRPPARPRPDGVVLRLLHARWRPTGRIRRSRRCVPTSRRISPVCRRPSVITAEYDPLRDEGEAYAAALRDAGVEVAHSRYDGMIHGFFGLGSLFDAGNDAVAEVGRAVRAAFGTL